MKSIILVITTSLALSACALIPSAPEYECKLTEVQGAKCASMDDSYRAARSMSKGDNLKVQSVFDSRVQSKSNVSNTPVVGQASNFPEPGQTGMPVFQQPRVMRAWVAPYVDAEGNLRTGEYVYFATPGQWNYGSTTRAGTASGIFEPGKPGKAITPSIGEGPRVAATTANAPPRPAETMQDNKSTPVNTADKTSITQPYQRLSQ
ncbi:MAG: type IV conjugative transfer system lipoprotein TraV [Agitococcus sp.]|nr:type IV conjugative transfer system lipoprotein TraV [Agitococcus sp.]MDO9176995.1 type IV conjugative transfer system lipoprotein TraV [Agitococcus sp.]